VICTEVQDLRERVADMAGHDGVSKAIEFDCGHVWCGRGACADPHTVRWSSAVRCPRTAKPIRQITIPILEALPNLRNQPAPPRCFSSRKHRLNYTLARDIVRIRADVHDSLESRELSATCRFSTPAHLDRSSAGTRSGWRHGN
jgi:hypothetical protein